LHAPPEPGETTRQGRFLWRKPDGAWASNDLGGGAQVVAKHLDQFAKAVHDCDTWEERAKTPEDYFAVLEQLAPIQRSARNLHGVLQEARQLCPEDRDLISFRDRAYEIERTAELLQAETKNSFDLLMARRAEEQAESSRRMAVSTHRLNLLAAFFFPVAALSGILGVNLALPSILQTTPAPLPFLAFVGVGLALGLILTVFVAASRRD
jgi:Mg2+ and Co2+ transporter CorA